MDQLSLFDSEEYFRFPKELLEYTDHFLPEYEASQLEELLIRVALWKQRTQKMYDKMVLTPRLTAWYGDESRTYKLGGNDFNVNPWLPELLALKQKIEESSGYQFNSVLLNLYRDGNDFLWHGTVIKKANWETAQSLLL